MGQTRQVSTLTTTTQCHADQGVCTVQPPDGPDSRFRITARGGRQDAVLFGTLKGGERPNCPGYRPHNTDWVSYGFQQPGRGASWRKSVSLTLLKTTSRAGAVRLSRQVQICFEAAYRFGTRAGYRLGHSSAGYAGVLPDCSSGASPCVQRRLLLDRGHGRWTVRLVFLVPASREDPKSLG